MAVRGFQTAHVVFRQNHVAVGNQNRTQTGTVLNVSCFDFFHSGFAHMQNVIAVQSHKTLAGAHIGKVDLSVEYRQTVRRGTVTFTVGVLESACVGTGDPPRQNA